MYDKKQSLIAYFTGSTFVQVISDSITVTENMVYNTEVKDEIDFLKYVKQNITKFESVDIVIVDMSVLTNTDDEIVTALEMLRTMYDRLKIIVFAPYRQTGDEFLARCFGMGIMNIINTSDFLEIREELKICIQTGKTYKESVKYKDGKTEKVIVHHELKKTVNKRMVGLAGTETNIGVTHNSIVLANFLRKKGFMVALIEMNPSGAFERIRSDYEEKLFKEGYFTLNGIDFYPTCTEEKLVEVLTHSYNFILMDFGTHESCDRMIFEKCEDKFIISGSKPWELAPMNQIFKQIPKEALDQYIFCFNFTASKDEAGIREGMKEFEKIYFLKYTQDPFSDADFCNAEEIFAECIADEPEEKKGFFQRMKGGRKKKSHS